MTVRSAELAILHLASMAAHVKVFQFAYQDIGFTKEEIELLGKARQLIICKRRQLILKKRAEEKQFYDPKLGEPYEENRLANRDG